MSTLGATGTGTSGSTGRMFHQSAINFNKMNTNNLNYDYSSVMHYGRSFFASSFGADTIAPIPDSSVPIGQRNGMSYLDILRINRLYKCK
ncbi:High choriolytic enzyme 1 [Dissostichus eleginoides]|uniref:Metalloendopeptidase n=1 Tax=Dissostichus eleginoides TaxID=100907 RepID=A0AAD9BI28_DISEL|nr:High choriolytic enzyme 1 [Dissostichus eleginoides]